MRDNLRKLLVEYGNAQVEDIQETSIENCSLSFMQLRDWLLLLGNVLYEDLNSQIYVAYIRAGSANLSGAVVAMQLQGGTLFALSYAKEGAIKQNICKKAFQQLENAVQGKVVSSKYPRYLIAVLAMIPIVVLVAVRGCVFDRVAPNVDDELLAFQEEVQQTIDATKAYNSAVAKFNLAVDGYNKAVAITCIDNISGLPAKLETLSLESESYEDNAEVVRGENSKETIVADTKTVLSMEEQVKELTSIVTQITNPSGEWVEERLSAIDSITEVQAVTEECDPDGLLGKAGGYAACVYFAVKDIDASKVPGKSIIEKGTDAGGAVEVYPTLEEAKARCEYLSGFDGTILYSGSYAIVGTTVVRTSYKLTNEQQFDLTSAITSRLIAPN